MVSPTYYDNQPGARPSDRQAESSNYDPPNPRILAKLRELVEKARSWPAGAPEPPMTSDEQRVLFRIARGNGRMVPLPEIQRERTGGGFMSQITPRIHSLKHRYGFDIRNHQEGENSWYYLRAKEPSVNFGRREPQPATPTASFAQSLLFETGRAR